MFFCIVQLLSILSSGRELNGMVRFCSSCRALKSSHLFSREAYLISFALLSKLNTLAALLMLLALNRLNWLFNFWIV